MNPLVTKALQLARALAEQECESRGTEDRKYSPSASAVLNALDAAEAAPPEDADAFRKALDWYADPKNWWTPDVGRIGYHNTNMDGSLERLAGRPGVVDRGGRFVHQQFWPDLGTVAKTALKGHRS